MMLPSFSLRGRLGMAVIPLALVAVAAAAAAQWGEWGRLPEGPRVPRQFMPADYRDGAFAVCKVVYASVRREAGGVGWSTDYPYAGHNLMIRLSELTKTRVSRRTERAPGAEYAPLREADEPNHWVVRLTDDALFGCPFTMAADVGTMGLTADEVVRLREYLLKGGFLWVDDFWGTRAWEQWSREIHRVLPEHRIVDVPANHPVRRTMFQIDTIPQVPNIGFWRRSGGRTSERGSDSPEANFRMIADDRNRIMVLMTHNTDIADSWEREAEDPEFFRRFSPDGYALGINVALYAMTH